MKPKTKTILFLLASFLLGILCGWILEQRIGGVNRHARGMDKKDFIAMLTEKLKLDSVQAVKVDSILETNKVKMEAFKKQALAMRDTIGKEIKKILNPEQTRIFDELNQNIDKKDEKRHQDKSGKGN